jgi:hypothetical protein
MKLILILLFALLLTGCGRNANENLTNVPPERGYFPSIHINGVNRQRIDRHIWMRGITISVESEVDEFNFSDAPAAIRGRGNSTWGMEKQPFRIRFGTPRPMLDAAHYATDWTLIANHSDKSFMRHYSAYYFSALLDTMDFSPYARFVHLYIDGAYRGVYQLSDQVEAGQGRAELTFHQDPRESEFLIELNMRAAYNNAVEGIDFIRVNGLLYEFRFPRGNQLTAAHIEYAREFLSRIDTMIMETDYSIFNYIHLPSFVDYYIIRELYKCQDVGRFSVFMQIRGQGSERRLEMGPVWDFDISAGNTYYQGQRYHSLDGIAHLHGYGPRGVWAAIENRWFRMLMRNQQFFDAVVTRWEEVRENQFPALINHINFMAERYQLEFERNFERWPILGRFVWPNPRTVVEIDTFIGQVEYLTNFLETRAKWLEENFWR